MSRIRIANPQPGSAKYTSASRAERYVRCKKAVMIDGELHFLSRAEEWRTTTFIKRPSGSVKIEGGFSIAGGN
jgi:hypothetical protein